MPRGGGCPRPPPPTRGSPTSAAGTWAGRGCSCCRWELARPPPPTALRDAKHRRGAQGTAWSRGAARRLRSSAQLLAAALSAGAHVTVWVRLVAGHLWGWPWAGWGCGHPAPHTAALSLGMNTPVHHSPGEESSSVPAAGLLGATLRAGDSPGRPGRAGGAAVVGLAVSTRCPLAPSPCHPPGPAGARPVLSTTNTKP